MLDLPDICACSLPDSFFPPAFFKKKYPQIGRWGDKEGVGEGGNGRVKKNIIFLICTMNTGGKKIKLQNTEKNAATIMNNCSMHMQSAGEEG